MIVLLRSVAYPVTVLVSFGWKFWSDGLTPASYVRRSRSLWDLRVLRRTGLFKLRLIDLSPFAHFYERLGFTAQGPFADASAHKAKELLSD